MFERLWDKILTALRLRTHVGGFDVSDSALRYAFFDRGTWRTASLRLPLGIIEGGFVKNHEQFVEALGVLKEQIAGPKAKKDPVNVVVAIPSENIYSQVFSLPMIEGENLEKAIQLNIQMVSPGEAAETYAGWEVIGKDEHAVRLEIMSAFANRTLVDAIHHGLHEAGFVVYAVEPRAVALARTVRGLGSGFNQEEANVVMNMDTAGIEFLVVRRGQLYFQYFTPWQDFVEKGTREISASMFRAIILRSMHQVLNFYAAHWNEKVQTLYLATTNFAEEIAGIVEADFSLAVRPLTLALRDQQFAPEWYAAIGSGLRGASSRRKDTGISLLGLSAQEEFRRHQLSDFFKLWRVVMPVTFAILALTLGVADLYFAREAQSLMTQANQASFTPTQALEVEQLRSRANAFNQMVAAIAAVLHGTRPAPRYADQVMNIFGTQHIVINHITVQNGRVSIVALAQTEEQVKGVKQALTDDPTFTAIDLPIAGVQKVPEGVTFTVSFAIAS